MVLLPIVRRTSGTVLRYDILNAPSSELIAMNTNFPPYLPFGDAISVQSFSIDKRKRPVSFGVVPELIFLMRRL